MSISPYSLCKCLSTYPIRRVGPFIGHLPSSPRKYTVVSHTRWPSSAISQYSPLSPTWQYSSASYFLCAPSFLPLSFGLSVSGRPSAHSIGDHSVLHHNWRLLGSGPPIGTPASIALIWDLEANFPTMLNQFFNKNQKQLYYTTIRF